MESGDLSHVQQGERAVQAAGQRMTPTVSPVSTRTRMLSSSAARISLAASSGSSITRLALAQPEQVDVGAPVRPAVPAAAASGLGPAVMAGGLYADRAPTPVSALTSDATCREPRAGNRQRLHAERIAGQVDPSATVSATAKANSPCSRRNAPGPSRNASRTTSVSLSLRSGARARSVGLQGP